MLIATKTPSVALHQQDKGKGKERECHHRGVVSSVPVSSSMPAQSIGVAATASATVDTAFNPNPVHPQQEPQQLQQQQHLPQQPRGVSELVPIQERLLAIQVCVTSLTSGPCPIITNCFSFFTYLILPLSLRKNTITIYYFMDSRSVFVY